MTSRSTVYNFQQCCEQRLSSSRVILALAESILNCQMHLHIYNSIFTSTVIESVTCVNTIFVFCLLFVHSIPFLFYRHMVNILLI